jgi:hypothetical protein
MKGHTINRQIFEFTCRSESRASGVQREIVHYVAGAVNAIAAAVLDAAGEGGHYVIDKLDIDLGDVPADAFGDADMLHTFRQRLQDQVRQRVPIGGAPGGRTGEDSPEWAVTQAFLLHGDVPWWLDKSRPIDVEEWLEKLMQTQPAALLSWLARVPAPATVRQRLLTQYRTAGRSLVQAWAAATDHLTTDHSTTDLILKQAWAGVEGQYPGDFPTALGYRLGAAALYQMLLTRNSGPVTGSPAGGIGLRGAAGLRSLAGWFRYWEGLGLAPAGGAADWETTPAAEGGLAPSRRVSLRAALQALPLEQVRRLLREARAKALRKARSEPGGESWDPAPSGTEPQTRETGTADDTGLPPPATVPTGRFAGHHPAPEPSHPLSMPQARATDETVFPDGLAVGGTGQPAATHRPVPATKHSPEPNATPGPEATGFNPGDRSRAESHLLAGDPSPRTPAVAGLPRAEAEPAAGRATGDPVARTPALDVPTAREERVWDGALAADPSGRDTLLRDAGSGAVHPPLPVPAGRMPGKAHTLAALLARATGEAMLPGETAGGSKPANTYRLALATGIAPGHDATGNSPEISNGFEASDWSGAGNGSESGDHAEGAGNASRRTSSLHPGTGRREVEGTNPFPGHAPHYVPGLVPGHVPVPRDPKDNGPAAAPAGKVAGTGQETPRWKAAGRDATSNEPVVSPADGTEAASGLTTEREQPGEMGNGADPVAARWALDGYGSPAARRTGLPPAGAAPGVQANPSREPFVPRRGGYRVGLPLPVRRLAERALVRLQAQADGQKRQRILRLEAARQVLEHPYLFEYELLQCFAAPPPGNRPTAVPAAEPASPPSNLRSNLSGGGPAGRSAAEPVPGLGSEPEAVFAADLRALRGRVGQALSGLPAAHAEVLHDVLRKQKFDTEGEKNVVRQVLLKLPAGALRLFQFFTQLSREEMAQLFEGGKNEPAPAGRVPGRDGAYGYAPAPSYPPAEGRRILLENAGLCLLTPYLPTLFNRLGYLEGKGFKHCAAAHRAVYLLQYLASGGAAAPEFLLQLNKLLAGLEADAAVLPGCRLTKAERTEADGLIVSAVSYWKALKNTSADGFRQSFLLRKGILQEKEEHWLLQVERREYDLLLDSLPWGFGIVKFPWMKKHLQVVW